MRGCPATAAPPPFLRLAPPGEASALVVSVPHAGRFYPPAVDAHRAVAWQVLEELEDRYVDRLLAPLLAQGATAVVATHARAWIDLNRDPADRPDAPASPHGRAGLGIVPERLGGRALWRWPAATAEIDARVAACHRPYHAAVAATLAAAHARHGHALLIDLHSMPPVPSGAGRGAGLVIGDRHGTSAAEAVSAALLASARAEELRPARNTPYAGAWTVARHGRPEGQVHAVQLELCRSRYLDPALREPIAALADVAARLARICAAGAAAAAADALPLAAE